MKLNFEQKELFEWKYKRQAKIWTIEEVHFLYLKALERHNIRIEKLIDVMDRIVNETPKIEKDKRKVYFTRGGKIYQRDFTYWREYDSWGSSKDLVKFSKDKRIPTKLYIIK